MGSEDDSGRGCPPGGGNSGNPGDTPEEERGFPTEFKTVKLVCLFCRDVRMIHVPVECDTPKEVLWECLTCQERWASRK